MSRASLLALWLLSDALIGLGSFALAYFLRVGFVLSSDFPFLPFIAIAAGVLPVWLLTMVATRVFALFRKQQSVRTGSYVLYACIVSVALFALSYYFVYGLFFSRLLLVYALVLMFGLTWAWHIAFAGMARRLMRSKRQFPTLIIGATREAQALIGKLHEAHSPLLPVAILDGAGRKVDEFHGVPVVGKLNKLEETLEKENITHMIQCSDLEQSINLLSACRQRGITYMLLPSVLGIVERDERIETLEGRQVTVIRPETGYLGWLFG